MLDHVSIRVVDYDRSKKFYEAALAPLGFTLAIAFYRAALAAGGRDNGAPGLRREYHANYYGAFVLDPDGYNIEAVCHKAE